MPEAGEGSAALSDLKLCYAKETVGGRDSPIKLKGLMSGGLFTTDSRVCVLQIAIDGQKTSESRHNHCALPCSEVYDGMHK